MSPRVTYRLLPAMIITLFLLLLTIGTALAHEHREVGPYEIVVGWRVEPALVEQPNGLDLRVSRKAEATEEHEEGEHTEGEGEGAHAETTPVEGLEETLKAEITFGGKTLPLELRASFGEPGSYTADLIPTLPGSYIFRISGEIEGVAIDETFDSADGEFSDIEPMGAIQFPEAVSSAGELQGQFLATQEAASSARTLAMVGIVTGVLGLLAGAAAFFKR